MVEKTTPTFCIKFQCQTNGMLITVIAYVQNGKLHIKIPNNDSDLSKRVYERFLAQLWTSSIAVCYYNSQDDSGAIIVSPSKLVAEKLMLSDKDQYKLGYVSNKLTQKRVVALEQNGTISIKTKTLDFTLDLLKGMFPSLDSLTMQDLYKQMAKDVKDVEFPELHQNTVSVEKHIVNISSALVPTPASVAAPVSVAAPAPAFVAAPAPALSPSPSPIHVKAKTVDRVEVQVVSAVFNTPEPALSNEEVLIQERKTVMSQIAELQGRLVKINAELRNIFN
jgi:hypothetical protein